MPYVLTVDQIGSRRHGDLVDLAVDSLAELPAEVGFTRTVGDEFQGVLSDPVSVVTAIVVLMRDEQWHVGIGVGDGRASAADRFPARPWTGVRRGPGRGRAGQVRPHHLAVFVQPGSRRPRPDRRRDGSAAVVRPAAAPQPGRLAGCRSGRSRADPASRRPSDSASPARRSISDCIAARRDSELAAGATAARLLARAEQAAAMNVLTAVGLAIWFVLAAGQRRAVVAGRTEPGRSIYDRGAAPGRPAPRRGRRDDGGRSADRPRSAGRPASGSGSASGSPPPRALVSGAVVTLAILALSDSAAAPPTGTPRTVLRGGAWIGALERIGLLGSLLAGSAEGDRGDHRRQVVGPLPRAEDRPVDRRERTLHHRHLHQPGLGGGLRRHRAVLS